MQRVEITAGDDVVGESLQDMMKALAMPGILDGFTMAVSGNQRQVSISPGAGLTDSGVFIYEDQTVETVELPIGGGPQDFTILYSYVPTKALGGSPAVLTYSEGLLNPDTFSGGLILGWIRHKGGAVLDQRAFIPGRRVKLTTERAKQKGEFDLSVAPLDKKWIKIAGPDLTVTEVWNQEQFSVLTTLSNVTASVKTVVYYFPVLIPSSGLGQLQLQVDVPNTSSLDISFLDTAKLEYRPEDTVPTLDDTTIYDPLHMSQSGAWTMIATGGLVTKQLSVPQNLNLVPGQLAYIKLNMTLQPGSYITYRSLAFSSYTEPF